MEGMVRYKEFLLVKVPEDATDFALHDLNDQEKLVFSSQIQDPLKCGGDMLHLLSGSWQIIGKADQLVESDWEGIVEGSDPFNYGGQTIRYWKDYEFRPNRLQAIAFVTEAKNSGLSLLASHNLEAKETLVLKIKE